MLTNLDLAVNQDLKSRVTYSVITKRLADDTMRNFIRRELDRTGLAHCFCCGKNWNSIDVLLARGWDSLPAVDVLKQWLVQHQEPRTRSQP